MKYIATPGNVVIEITSEAMKSSGGLILASNIQRLIVRSIDEGSSVARIGDEVEVQPHAYRQVVVGEQRYLLGPISGIQAIIVAEEHT